MHLAKSNLYAFLSSSFILICVLALVNNYLGRRENVILADGRGYYDYLPSYFIHDDLHRQKETYSSSKEIYHRIKDFDYYVAYKNYRINKYPIGTAVLEFPFFYATYLYNQKEGTQLTGYEPIFQNAFYYSTLFYLFWALFFFWKLLRLYEINYSSIILLQILLVFSTSTLYYSVEEASFSHIYSLFTINAFLFFSKRYFQNQKAKDFLFASLFIASIVQIRQINVLILFILPFIAGDYALLKSAIQSLIKKPLLLVFAAIIGATFIGLQCAAWYAQTGDWFVYSYRGETFDFTNPELFNILFSYRKGLFIYTPICFIGLLATLLFASKKQYFQFYSWWFFFLLITYIFSSWWSWYYGGSYGLRAYVEYYALFFIPLAILLKQQKPFFTIPIILIGSITSIITIIQTYQYKSYILHWEYMDKTKFWDVFLKTDDSYKGYLWKQRKNLELHSEILAFDLGDLKFEKGQSEEILVIPSENIPPFSSQAVFQITFDNDFKKEDKSVLFLTINSGDKNHYWNKKPLFHFKEKDFGIWQNGFAFYDLPKLDDIRPFTINVRIEASHELKLEKVKIVLLELRNFEESILKTMELIKQNEEWYNKIIEEAPSKSISVEENLREHATWVVNNSNQ